MSKDATVCKITFHGIAQTPQHWFEATSGHAIDDPLARDLQRREGYDPEIYGFLHFQNHKRDKSFIARWVCSSTPRKP